GVSGLERTKGSFDGAARRNAIVHHDHGSSGDLGIWTVSPIGSLPPFDFRKLLVFLQLNIFRRSADSLRELLVDHCLRRASVNDCANPELLIEGRPDLSDDEHIELCAQGSRN